MLELSSVALSILWPAVATQFICTVAVLPLAAFEATRTFAGKTLRFFSYLLGFTAWIWGFSVTYLIWGGWAVAAGIFFFGVGVVPMALVAASLEGLWATVGQMVVIVALLYGTRVMAIHLLDEAPY